MDEDIFDRLVQVIVGDEAMPYLFRDGMEVTDGVPDSARIISIHRMPAGQGFGVIFVDPQFDIVMEGMKIPRIQIGRHIPERGMCRYVDNHEEMNKGQIKMSYEIFSELFKTGRTIRSDFPDDVRLKEFWNDPNSRTVGVFLRSSEFEEREDLPHDIISIETHEDNIGIDSTIPLSEYEGIQ